MQPTAGARSEADVAGAVRVAAVDDLTSPRVWRAGTLVYSSSGLVALFCWLLWGDFAWSMKERLIWPVTPVLLKQFGANDTWVALLMGSLPAAITIVLGPIISYRSDRHRGRWGRRIPYLILTTPIAAAAMIAMAFSSQAGASVHKLLGDRVSAAMLVLVTFGFFWTIFEFATVAANAVFNALINDVVPVPVLGRFFGLFRALSLIAGIIFNFWLIGKAKAHYTLFFVMIGVFYGGGFLLMCLKVREGDYPPAPPPAPTSGGPILGPIGSFWSAALVYLRECFTSPYYLWVFLFWTVSWVAFIPVNLFSSVFATQGLGMSMDRYGTYLALTYSISLVLAPLLGVLVDRIHPLRATLGTLVLYSAVAIWGGLFATTVTKFGIAFVGHGVLSGCYFTAAASLQQRLFPRSKFAQFASAAGVLTSLCQIAVSFAIGKVLDLTHHTYRHTFTAGFVLSALSLVCGWIVYRAFLRLGGPEGYVAPEGDEKRGGFEVIREDDKVTR